MNRRNNGKDKFWRGLNLDKETRDIMKWYKKAKKQISNDEIDYNEIEGENHGE